MKFLTFNLMFILLLALSLGNKLLSKKPSGSDVLQEQDAENILLVELDSVFDRDANADELI